MGWVGRLVPNGVEDGRFQYRVHARLGSRQLGPVEVGVPREAPGSVVGPPVVGIFGKLAERISGSLRR